MKYLSLGFIITFFIFITIVGFRNCDKPSSHSHFYATKPEDERDYVVKENLPPHVLRENIIFEVFMGN
jgi:hypothetical protein